jgi:hypothetical protein
VILDITGRYDATVTHVTPFKPGDRDDVVAVRVRLDYAHGAFWAAADTPGPAIGDRYTITVQKRKDAQ